MNKRTFDIFDQNSEEELQGLESLQITKIRRKLKPKTTKTKIPPLRTFINFEQYNFSKTKPNFLSTGFNNQNQNQNQKQKQRICSTKSSEKKNFPNPSIDLPIDLRLCLPKRDRKNHDQRQEKINNVFPTNDEEFFAETELQMIIDCMEKVWEEKLSLSYGGFIEEKLIERAKIYNDFNDRCVNRSLSSREDNSFYL
ncbi:hypothetical protein M0813_30237 [Anaeramoeba flamelloides]|uniref:Uncharacterized protein n=1 Tax=Anaeramoeba flamelloides TaxID=1746091 RepID=A0ABQ8XKV8_9EUKA|nr:hypothetical protein M0813_30237 [Anaeramoeba flamelloides]